jgi:hypothetical protein
MIVFRWNGPNIAAQTLMVVYIGSQFTYTRAVTVSDREKSYSDTRWRAGGNELSLWGCTKISKENQILVTIVALPTSEVEYGHQIQHCTTLNGNEMSGVKKDCDNRNSVNRPKPCHRFQLLKDLEIQL